MYPTNELCDILVVHIAMKITAAEPKMALKTFSRHAMLPTGRTIVNNFAAKVHNGYPGGWATPMLHTVAINSPLSPPARIRFERR